MNKVKYTEWIDNYVDGELDNLGMKEFEAQLSDNQELAMEFKLEQDIRKAISEEADVVDFRAKCIEAQNEINISEKKLVKIVHITRKYWYAVASILLIALIIGGVAVINPGGYSSEKLFKMYYKSGETIGLSRSGNVDMAEALRYFSRNEFKTAESLFGKILTSDPNNFAVMYYSGISNIELENYPKSIMMFETIIKDGGNLYIENAEWYLGLSYLASDNMERSEEIFQQIASAPDHYYFEEARSILEKIGKSEKSKKILNNLLFLILPF
jgi:tetratricopeptide (TPR) repeat protein